MKKKPKIEEKANLTVRVEREYYDRLRTLSYKMSLAEGTKIGIGELIRRSLDNTFPRKKDQLDLFD